MSTTDQPVTMESTPAVAQKPSGIERIGIAPIPEPVRTSTPWTFFLMFMGASVAPASIIYGWVPITFGLDLWGSLSSIAVGVFVGAVLLIPLQVLGSQTATNNATASGAHFGVRGRLIGSFIGLTAMGMATAVAVWTGGGILIGLLQRLFDLPPSDLIRALSYVGTTVVAALIAIYGYHILLRAMTVIMVAGAVLMVLMLLAFADRINLGYAGGEYLMGSYWSTWLLSTVSAGVATVMLTATMLGDWTRYVSANRFPPRKLAPVTVLAILIGYIVPMGVGTILTTAFTDPYAPFPENLATSAPTWLAVVLLPLGFVGGLGFTAGTLYSCGLDLDSIVRRINRTQATLLISAVTIVIVLLGAIAHNAADSISAALLVLLALIAPWAAIVGIGYLRTRGTYDLDDLQVFNRRERGGKYWYTNGVNWRAVVAWVAGSVFGLLTVNTALYVGPLAYIANGFDISFIGSFTIAAVLYLVLEGRR